jgi:hypothetical protein
VCRFFVQRATVKLQNNEHDDTEHQQQRIRSHHDHLLRRFLHPQLPKIIIARREEWKSSIVRIFWYADDLVADMASTLTTIPRTLRKGDGFRTKNLIGTNRLSTVICCCYKLSPARFGHSIRGFVFCLMGTVQ